MRRRDHSLTGSACNHGGVLCMSLASFWVLPGTESYNEAMQSGNHNLQVWLTNQSKRGTEEPEIWQDNATSQTEWPRITTCRNGQPVGLSNLLAWFLDDELWYQDNVYLKWVLPLPLILLHVSCVLSLDIWHLHPTPPHPTPPRCPYISSLRADQIMSVLNKSTEPFH